MQYKGQLKIFVATKDKFGELTTGPEYKAQCAIIESGREASASTVGAARSKAGKNEPLRYTVIVPYKPFEPYASVVAQPELLFEIEGVRCKAEKSEQIRGSSTKPKYTELLLVEDTGDGYQN